MSIKHKFKLKNPSSDTLTSIQYYFYLDNARFTYSLGTDKRIHPALWDKDRMRPISQPSKPTLQPYLKDYPRIKIDLTNLTTRIENVISKTEQFISNCEINDKALNFEDLKDYLTKTFKAELPEKIKSNSLQEYLDKYILEMQSGQRLNNFRKAKGTVFSKDTIKSYRNLANLLERFRKTQRLSTIKFDHIDMKFYYDLQLFMYNQDYTPNYFGNMIKSLKRVMNVSLNEKLHQNIEFQKEEFKKTTNESFGIYLTERELQQMYRLVFDESEKHLEKYRDIFLIGCWTAQRHSDYSRIKPHWIREVENTKILEIKQQKGDTKVSIPLREEVLKLLEKYKFELPKTYSNKLNKALKTICQKLEWDEQIEVPYTKGSKNFALMIPKYKLVKSHTARRTGCTLMYKAGIPTYDIMMLSGHKTEKEFLKYIKVTREETALVLSKHSFFKGSKMKVVKSA